MIIKKQPDIRYSEVTPKGEYLNRRAAMQTIAGGLALAAGTASLAGATKLPGVVKSPLSITGEKVNSLQDATTYNNFYEFGTGKEDPAENAHRLRTSPWMVKVEGAVEKPRTLDMDAISKIAPLEERISRFRCVEAWSMVVPWVGYSLSALIKAANPTSQAKYVAFESFYDSKAMLSQGSAGIQFPYVEGLRMDEAMHPLALLCVGLYGETLPNQNGAPVRIILPWKYGFKSIKSINKIRFVEKQPPTTWNISNAREYGFYSNVNPEVDHPRWSQAKERRLGELLKRDTLKFNGYGSQVAGLYSGMDLKKNY